MEKLDEFTEWREDEGDTVIRVCRALSCTLNRSEDIANEYAACLGIKVGQTTPDNKYTLKNSFCFGRCAIGANVRINQRFFSRQEPGMAEANLRESLGDGKLGD